jgi:hypothetical protein
MRRRHGPSDQAQDGSLIIAVPDGTVPFKLNNAFNRQDRYDPLPIERKSHALCLRRLY